MVAVSADKPQPSTLLYPKFDCHFDRREKSITLVVRYLQNIFKVMYLKDIHFFQVPKLKTSLVP
jgi:hypothetical protein